jgi:hypothetical protein
VTPVKTPRKTVDDWNGRHPPRSVVVVRMDSGEARTTRTRGAAWVSNSGHPVVALDGIAGYYLLSRVHPVDPSFLVGVVTMDPSFVVREETMEERLARVEAVAHEPQPVTTREEHAALVRRVEAVEARLWMTKEET